jgi:YVTN family beta-propeller protein
VALIVKKVNGNWVDDNIAAGLNWNSAVTWDLHDHDVAVVDANALSVSYIPGLMNLNMNLAVRPGAQPAITVIGTDGLNVRRFEPIARGVFLRVLGASIPVAGGSPSMVDLNPHLNYSTPTIPQPQRDLSIGDPRGIDWRGDGQRAYIAGMGSNNVVVTDAALARIALINVGQGPTAVKFDHARGLVYVLNRFAGTISVIDDSTLAVDATVSLFDPTPNEIRLGRPHLYNTHKSSGLGHISCASCHVDARMDQLAWDLGDPQGSVASVPTGFCMSGDFCLPFHPMKGPMVTQTLVGIMNNGPMHWRGDRADLAAFNPAFVGLQGDDAQLSVREMAEFENFIDTIRFPPQPNRNFDNSLKNTPLANGGIPTLGEATFGGLALNCIACHATPSGTNGLAHVLGGQTMKMPHLRNQYEKTGFSKTSMSNNRGFGFNHDGTNATIFDFLVFNGFPFSGDQERRDSEAFVLSWASDTHAAVGVQTTVVNGASISPSQQSLIEDMLAQGDKGNVGLVVKGRLAGMQRGWSYVGASDYQSDRAAESIAHASLLALAAAGNELTWTVVPSGSQARIGIDRDSDGFFDRDELDACSDPADPLENPTNVCIGDTNGSHSVDVDDLIAVILTWGLTGAPGALPTDVGPGCGNGVVDVDDLIAIILNWGACP